MTKDQFAELGALLYGPNFKLELARQLGINPSTVHAYAVGSSPVKQPVAMAMQGLARERVQALQTYT